MAAAGSLLQIAALKDQLIHLRQKRQDLFGNFYTDVKRYQMSGMRRMYSVPDMKYLNTDFEFTRDFAARKIELKQLKDEENRILEKIKNVESRLPKHVYRTRSN